PSSTYTVSPTSHPPLFRASLPSSRLCTNTHLASKPITPSSHVWHGTNVVLAFLSHDRATTSHLLNQLPTLTLQHNPALTFGMAKRGQGFIPSPFLHYLLPFHKPGSCLASLPSPSSRLVCLPPNINNPCFLFILKTSNPCHQSHAQAHSFTFTTFIIPRVP
ncbi:hypothetical protein PIB30_106805, partial [Stylosanthes scabra]|nr:hypothetical protein [Stylosanthes scabra]